jgi:hypothetical protein
LEFVWHSCSCSSPRKKHRLTQNISFIMCWPQLNSFLFRMRLLFKNKYFSFIWTIRSYTSQKLSVEKLHQDKSQSLLIQSAHWILLHQTYFFWIYQVKDHRSIIFVCRWLAWGDKRDIWPFLEVNPWKGVWWIAGSSPDLN